MKACSKCKIVKPFSEFYKDALMVCGHSSQCRQCQIERSLRWKKNNRIRNAKNSSSWYHANQDKAHAGQRRYRLENRDKVRKTKSAVKKKQRANNPEFRLKENYRNRVYCALKRGAKSASTMELLGCSIGHLKVWLTFYFQPGMTWKNYGPVWHVDHIKPCAAFNLLDPAQQKECFHFTNLQPLFAEDNRKKLDKYEGP